MSALLKIAAYFLGTLLLGAILAPQLFWVGHAVGARQSSLAWLAKTDLQRYFDRAMFLAAVALLWPAVRWLRVDGWRDLGIAPDPRPKTRLAVGFVLAAGGLWMLGLLLWQQGIYQPRSTGANGPALVGFLVSALAVAVAEEAFFRGALQGLVARTAPASVALVSVAALFAILHFLKPPEHTLPPTAVTWTSGFVLLPRAFWQWGDARLVAGGFATLFAVGLVLGQTRLRTRSLWLPIGLHAGWVFGLKSFSRLSRHVVASGFWFGEDLLHGLGPVLTVLLTGTLVLLWLRKDAAGADRPPHLV